MPVTRRTILTVFPLGLMGAGLMGSSAAAGSHEMELEGCSAFDAPFVADQVRLHARLRTVAVGERTAAMLGDKLIGFLPGGTGSLQYVTVSEVRRDQRGRLRISVRYVVPEGVPGNAVEMR